MADDQRSSTVVDGTLPEPERHESDFPDEGSTWDGEVRALEAPSEVTLPSFEVALPVISSGVDGNLELQRHLRTCGLFEEWTAELDDGPGQPREVVVRRALPDREDASELHARLIKGCEVARKVAHQNVLQCFGLFESDGGVAQLFEPTARIDLSRLLRISDKEERPIEISLAIWIVRSVCEALAHAHSSEVIHRALRPAAVFVTQDGEVKVDFSLVTFLADKSSDTVATEQIDLAYAAPEEIDRDCDVDVRADVYSAGCLLWELLAGAPPRQAFASRREAQRKSISRLRSEVPEELEACLERALGTSPEQRYGDARAFCDALTKVFYVGLDGDDARDGSDRLLEWVQRGLVGTPSSKPSEAPARATRSVRGRFTEMLEARALPVMPSDLTHDDVDTGAREFGEVPPPPLPPLPRVIPAGTDRRSPPTSKSRALLPALFVVAIAVGISAWMFLRPEKPELSGTEMPTRSQSIRVISRKPVEPQVARIRLASNPSKASVVDETGKSLGLTPLLVEVKNGASRKLELRLEGHAVQTVIVDGTGSHHTVQLEAVRKGLRKKKPARKHRTPLDEREAVPW